MSGKITRETVLRLKGGDDSAFDRVFLTYFDKLRLFINGIIRSEEDATELSQDIFVKIWLRRESLDPDRSFTSYLYTLARNSALNFIKHRYVEDSYLKELPAEPLAEDSEEIVFARETQLLVNMTVAGMPEQRRTIYDLSRNQGKSNDEIADALKISRKTVENQISLAVRDIKAVLRMFIAFFS